MLKVGVVGAGPVAQAIHLPTLARFGDQLRVTAVMDVDAALAEQVARPWGARATTALADFLADDPPDIAVIGTPDRFHAEQIEAACAAGVRGILAEKPLATSLADARRVAAAVAASGTALVVGAMHTYDPAWLASQGVLGGGGPFHVRSAIYLPGNPRFEDMATTMVRPPAAARPAATAADRLRGGILGLAIHNLPLIRRALPTIDRVDVAAAVEPWGYVLTASGAAGTVELLARTGGTWRPEWTLSFWGAGADLHLDFPPSYVHAGSATATVRDQAGTRVFGPYPTNGYQAEWQELLAVLGGAEPRYGPGVLVDDLGYALDLADLAVAAIPERAAA